MELGKDYQFININGMSCVELLDTDFKGVIFSYKDVSLNVDDNEELPATLSFHFDIIRKDKYYDEELTSTEFKDLLGDILISIIINSEGVKSNGFIETDIEESSL